MANTVKLITGVVRFSYVHVFEPQVMAEGQEPKYSVSIVIDKKDTATINGIKAAVEQVIRDNKSLLADKTGRIPQNLKLPLRDGDIERPDSPEYGGSMFMTASSYRRPGVIDTSRRALIGGTEFYSGCYGKASLNVFAFAAAGNKGVAVGLNNILKTADGERLDGGASAESDFSADLSDDALL